jgi:hypothetical protein
LSDWRARRNIHAPSKFEQCPSTDQEQAREQPSERPRSRVPADDIALRREVDKALQDLPGNLPEPDVLAALASALRPWYRAIQIRVREDLAGYDDDPTRVWYIYRDGRIRRRNEELEHLYGAMAGARDTIRSSERVLEESRTITRGAGYRDRLAGPPERSVDAPTARETVVAGETTHRA